ncbi:MFS transporter [Spongiactinospora rosea]|uniref:MFS transporter n=1 Tax=Spongiactinospora rosea TaxID=2248750 RepID=A0A366M557_9ACTN|nr:MFS transporter [Spongiactinospora rosea]RBQ21346.1 MFS transporter [Spongiactinospora rosea]
MTATLPARPSGHLLRERGFRGLYLSAAVSQFGSQLTLVGLPLLAVSALGAGAGEVGLLSALATLTALVVGLPAGAWVDRAGRRGVMIAADLGRAAVLGSVPLAWWAGGLSMAQLYAVAVLTGVGRLFFEVAAQSVLPDVVGRDRLTAANSMLVGTSAAMDVSGNGLAGVVVQVAGAPVAIVIDTLTYLWSAWWLRAVPSPAPSRGRTGMGRQIADGVRFVRGSRVLVVIMIQGAMVNLGIPLVTALLPVLMVGEMHLPAWTLGAYLSASGLGVLAGSASAHLLSRWLGQGRATWLVGVWTAPAALALPFIAPGPGLWVSAAAYFAVTFRIGVNNVTLTSFRQQVTPDALLGRVNATMRMVLTGAVGLGGLLAALVGELYGVRAALWCGAVVLALSWVPIAFSSTLRR